MSDNIHSGRNISNVGNSSKPVYNRNASSRNKSGYNQHIDSTGESESVSQSSSVKPRVLRLLSLGNIMHDQESSTLMFNSGQVVQATQVDNFLHIDDTGEFKDLIKRNRGTFITGSLHFDKDFLKWRFIAAPVEPTMELHFKEMLTFPHDWIDSVKVHYKDYTNSPTQIRAWCAALEELFGRSGSYFHVTALSIPASGDRLMFDVYHGPAGELRKLLLIHSDYGVTRIVVRKSIHSDYVYPVMEQVYSRLTL